MKKLILISMVAFACNHNNKYGSIVTAKRHCNGYCSYTVRNTGPIQYMFFNDDCDKFKIGDTLHFKK